MPKPSKKNISQLLLPLSLLYGMVVTWRNILFDKGILKSKSFQLPIICVGNLTVGGTGKTPHTEYLVKLLQEQFNVAVLSRGYKRKKKGFRIAETNSTVADIGDEPYQIKQKFPNITVAVCKQRVKGIKQLLKSDIAPDVILLDDAYQHRYVKAGLNILLTDQHRLIYKDHLLPYGHLREGFESRDRADIVIVTKCSPDITQNEMREIEHGLRLNPHQKLFFSTFRYGDLLSVWGDNTRKLSAFTENTKVFLLTGIANPKPILNLLHGTKAEITSICYPDHHHFTPGDISHINKKFNALSQTGDALIITTEKDASRLKFVQGLSESVLKHLYYLPIEIEILNNLKATFNNIIIEYVRQNQGNSLMA
ncbi:MAG TPA: tetraacyldisaccharide 4'-kinase [Prevotellaceae bacterium]|jgi:tetraacyldisaccharide 4'-kinase|nr:tetraacyldisaccharide 4'-kinase [Prevotellaceae bacterium]